MNFIDKNTTEGRKIIRKELLDKQMKKFKNEKFDLDVNHKTNHINRAMKGPAIGEKLKAMMGGMSGLLNKGE